MSKIENTIDEMEDYIEGCKKVTFSSSRIMVNKEELENFLRELRLRTPEEIKRYQKLISNRDAIIADAREQADKMIREAQVHTEELINEHEIMQRAIEQANALIADASRKAQDIVDRAASDANNIRLSAINYTDDMLGNLQKIIEYSIESNQSKYDSLMASLNKNLNIVVSNRKELIPDATEADSDEQELAESVKEAMEDEDGYVDNDATKTDEE